MKKLVAWAIVLTMVCFTMCGCGSKIEEIKELEGDFTIHSGVKFGDTIEEVKEKETLELKVDSSDNEVIQLKLMMYNGELVGYTNSTLTYYYNEDGKVIRATYSLYDSNEEEERTNGKGKYDKVYKLMKEKYGTPINKEDYEYLRINKKDNGYKESGLYTNYKIDGWLLKYKTYYVEIILEMTESEYKDKSKGTFEMCGLEYVYHTNEEIEESKEAIEREKEEKENREKRAIDDL